MADEGTIEASLSFTKNTASMSMALDATNFDVSATPYYKGIQEVTTSEAVLSLGGISSPGQIMVKNLDSTNFVEIRAGTGLADLVKISAGRVATFEVASGATPYIISDTATVLVEVAVLSA